MSGLLTRRERAGTAGQGDAQSTARLPGYGLVGLFFGDDSKLYEGLSDRWLDEWVVAVIAAGLLFVLPVDWGRRQFTLNWNQAPRIDWARSSSSGPASPSAR